MSDVRVSHCVPVPVTSRCSLSLGSSVPASLLVTRSQPEPGPESRLSALTGGCLLRLRVSQKQTRSGGEQSSLTSPVHQNISREQKMMKKTTLIAKIISSDTFYRCNKIFLSALIKFPLKPSASMMCLWGWGQGGAGGILLPPLPSFISISQRRVV